MRLLNVVEQEADKVLLEFEGGDKYQMSPLTLHDGVVLEEDFGGVVEWGNHPRRLGLVQGLLWRSLSHQHPEVDQVAAGALLGLADVEPIVEVVSRWLPSEKKSDEVLEGQTSLQEATGASQLLISPEGVECQFFPPSLGDGGECESRFGPIITWETGRFELGITEFLLWRSLLQGKSDLTLEGVGNLFLFREVPWLQIVVNSWFPQVKVEGEVVDTE